MVLLCLLALFLGSSWLIALLPELFPDIHHYEVYLAWLAALTIGYGVWLWRRREPVASWRLGAIAAFVGTLASPVLYETDPIRYYWDGLSVIRGESPYVTAPADHPQFAEVPWAEQLNYPELPTIYPPGAQALFAVATALNPWFYGPSRPEANDRLGAWSAVKVASLWQASFGWKLVMAVFGALAIVLWRHRRWDLLLAHPLFLTKFALNVHIDGVLMVLVIAATLPTVLRSPSVSSALLVGLSIATKWITALVVPFIALFQASYRAVTLGQNRWAALLRHAVVYGAVAGAVAVAAVVVGQWGAEGKFFYSFKKFASDWLFFGFWQRWLMDALLAYGLPSAEALRYSKWGGYIGIILFYIIILVGYGRSVIARPPSGRAQLISALAVALLVFYSGLPVINPWYLLVLVPFAIEVRHSLLSPMALTLAVSASAAYYYRYEDPIIMRYVAYGLVVAALAIDLGHWLRSRNRLESQVG